MVALWRPKCPVKDTFRTCMGGFSVKILGIPTNKGTYTLPSTNVQRKFLDAVALQYPRYLGENPNGASDARPQVKLIYNVAWALAQNVCYKRANSDIIGVFKIVQILKLIGSVGSLVKADSF